MRNKKLLLAFLTIVLASPILTAAQTLAPPPQKNNPTPDSPSLATQAARAATHAAQELALGRGEDDGGGVYALACFVDNNLIKVPACEQGVQAALDEREAADTSGAIAFIQGKEAEAGDVSEATGQMLQNLQQQDSSDADTSAAMAVIQENLKEANKAAQDLVSATPDTSVVQVQSPLPDVSAQTNDDSIAASTSSEDGAPSQPPNTNAYMQVLQTYQQALENLNSAVSNAAAARATPMPSAADIKASQRPQIKAAPRCQIACDK